MAAIPGERALQRPFLKWAGNKYAIIDRLRAILPAGRRLIEPFAGSAAVFLNTDYPAYVLADANADLITLYQLLQTAPEHVIEAAQALCVPEHNAGAAYQRLRDEFNATTEPLRRATLFIYLNRHAYNGLCRYNSRGGFNTPFGRYTRPYFPAAELRAFAARLSALPVQLHHGSFATTMAVAGAGDIVYADPPYVPLSVTAHFTSYSADGFGLAEQEQLAAAAHAAAARGATVVISNHDTPLTRQFYRGAHLTTFEVRRMISCNGQRRDLAPELLAVFDGSAGA